MKIIFKKSYKLYKTSEFEGWLEEQSLKSQVQIANRFSKIEVEGHFGENKFLDDDLWELKWTNGRRVYYAYIRQLNILILLGGNKNGQDKDIKQARKIFKKYLEPQD